MKNDLTTGAWQHDIGCPISITLLSTSDVLCQEGLFDVFWPSLPIACPCIFKASGWAQRALLAKETLRAVDNPLEMDEILLTDRRAQAFFNAPSL
jgi:hypothetical protein